MVINSVLKKAERLVSLDFFRGLVIVLMILVNNVWGDTYPPLQHASWNGWTFADTVFPFFLWIIGVAMVFSFTKRINGRHSKKELFLHILKRSLILFAFGFFLNLFPYFDFAAVRIPGVLQLIAITYFFAGVIFLYTRPKWQVVLTVFILLASALMIKFVPVPGYGSGVLEPERNLAHYIDGLLLKGHMWEQTKGWDPEGLFSTFSAISTVLLGVLMGHLLISKRNKIQKAGLMALSGIVFMMAGYVINIWLPINKNLWTSSFSIFMAGLASVIFSVSYWLIDIKGCKKWSFPFVICGLNAIALYMFSSIVSRLLLLIKVNGGTTLYFVIYKNLYLQIAAPIIASLLFAFTHVLIIFLAAYVMYKNKLFLKI
ncbi:MAG: DUF5009 domain-containing protein [Nanoarchaeota archaeon]|nr:DUF5009 domain-containing protein [Nanoarchaeota archaeon]